MKTVHLLLTATTVLCGLLVTTSAGAEPAWSIEGRAISADSCEVACPCNIGGPPHHGKCDYLMIFHIDTGSYGQVKLDGAEFAMAGEFTRKAFGEPTKHSFIAFYVDAHASAEQKQALQKLLTGPAFAEMGQPTEIKEAPIQIENLDDFGQVEKTCAGTVGDLAKVQVTPVAGGTDKSKPLVIDNQAEPGFLWTALGRTTESFYKSAGKSHRWDGTSGESVRFKMSGGEE